VFGNDLKLWYEVDRGSRRLKVHFHLQGRKKINVEKLPKNPTDLID